MNKERKHNILLNCFSLFFESQYFREGSLTSQVLHRSQAPENETLSGRDGMSETNRATRACVGVKDVDANK